MSAHPNLGTDWKPEEPFIEPFIQEAVRCLLENRRYARNTTGEDCWSVPYRIFSPIEVVIAVTAELLDRSAKAGYGDGMLGPCVEASILQSTSPEFGPHYCTAIEKVARALGRWDQDFVDPGGFGEARP